MPSLFLQTNLICSYMAKLATPLHHMSYGIMFHPAHRNRYKLNIQAPWHIIATYNFQWKTCLFCPDISYNHPVNTDLMNTWKRTICPNVPSVICGSWLLIQTTRFIFSSGLGCVVFSSLHAKHPQDSLLWVHNRLSTHYQDSTTLFLSSKCRKIVFYFVPSHMDLPGNEATWFGWFILLMTLLITAVIQNMGKGDYDYTYWALKPSHTLTFSKQEDLTVSSHILLSVYPIKIPIWCNALCLNSSPPKKKNIYIYAWSIPLQFNN